MTTLSLNTPWDYKTIQPDVHMESVAARVFIEVKVKAPLTLSQIKKYAQLHNDLDEPENAKRRYILFLVNSNRLRLGETNELLDRNNIKDLLPNCVGPEANGITFGYGTWAEFAMTLKNELERSLSEPSDSAEMLTILIGDFLNDLSSRGLFSTSSVKEC